MMKQPSRSQGYGLVSLRPLGLLLRYRYYGVGGTDTATASWPVFNKAAALKRRLDVVIFQITRIAARLARVDVISWVGGCHPRVLCEEAWIVYEGCNDVWMFT